jgi:hypothetical protein
MTIHAFLTDVNTIIPMYSKDPITIKEAYDVLGRVVQISNTNHKFVISGLENLDDKLSLRYGKLSLNDVDPGKIVELLQVAMASEAKPTTAWTDINDAIKSFAPYPAKNMSSPMTASTELLDAYLEAALWSSTDESTPSGGEPMDKNYSISDITGEAKQKAEKDCDEFVEKAGELLDGLDMEKVGRDFWLTRNGHGAGFWDGDYEREVGEKLTDIAHDFGEVNLYVGDDEQIHAYGAFDIGDEQDEEDIFFTSSGNLGSKTSLSAGGKHIGEYDSFDKAEEAAMKWMKKHKFFPNAWTVSDHGNTEPHIWDKDLLDLHKPFENVAASLKGESVSTIDYVIWLEKYEKELAEKATEKARKEAARKNDPSVIEKTVKWFQTLAPKDQQSFKKQIGGNVATAADDSEHIEYAKALGEELMSIKLGMLSEIEEIDQWMVDQKVPPLIVESLESLKKKTEDDLNDIEQELKQWQNLGAEEQMITGAGLTLAGFKKAVKPYIEKATKKGHTVEWRVDNDYFLLPIDVSTIDPEITDYSDKVPIEHVKGLSSYVLEHECSTYGDIDDKEGWRKGDILVDFKGGQIANIKIENDAGGKY